MIKYLIIDVDGTLTDGIVYIGNEGELCKGFYVRDGLGIQQAIKRGIKPIIMTSRDSGIVIKRCQELGITEIYQGVADKKECLADIMDRYNISKEDVAYIADDINDLKAIQLVDMRGCPSDAVQEIKAVCSFVSKYEGGHGAVREFIEYIFKTCNQ